MKKHLLPLLALTAVFLTGGCTTTIISHEEAASSDLVGAWRGKVQFTTGAYATIKDFDFLYAFNAGGTMTESSNYDAMPPCTPAYGVWKKAGPRTYEARYVYYWTKPPAKLDELTAGGGWAPGGYGVLTQKFTLAADGNSFDSTISYEVFDQQGKPTEAPSVATASATRIKP